MGIRPYQTDLLQNDFGKSPLDKIKGSDTEIIIMQLPMLDASPDYSTPFRDNGYLNMDSKILRSIFRWRWEPVFDSKSQFKTRLKLPSNICGGPKMGI